MKLLLIALTLFLTACGGGGGGGDSSNPPLIPTVLAQYLGVYIDDPNSTSPPDPVDIHLSISGTSVSGHFDTPSSNGTVSGTLTEPSQLSLIVRADCGSVWELTGTLTMERLDANMVETTAGCRATIDTNAQVNAVFVSPKPDIGLAGNYQTWSWTSPIYILQIDTADGGNSYFGTVREIVKDIGTNYQLLARTVELIEDADGDGVCFTPTAELNLNNVTGEFGGVAVRSSFLDGDGRQTLITNMCIISIHLNTTVIER